uniref:glutamic acid-rich protein-like n=1 Tax=Erigeron canadensis TaxID=72917 RepID=UPI001CB9A281|nr:glutamic acid-rich protein-like [Erigeron canadensis]
MDNSEKDGEDMPGSEFDDDVEQDYQEEAATKIPKMKGQVIDIRKGINSNVQEFDNGDRRIGQLIDTNPTKQNKSKEKVTKAELIKKNLDHSTSVTRHRANVAKRKLFAIDNDDEYEERDLRFDAVFEANEAQDDAEADDIEDMDVNDVYEEQDSSEDDEDEDMDDLPNENDSENEDNELVDEELEVPEYG